MRAGLEGYRSSGAFIDWPYYLGLLADALLHAGEPEEALEQITAAFEAAASRPGYYYEPELQRLKARAMEMIG